MTLEIFNQLLTKVSPFLVKNNNRKPLCPEQRLLITLRYLSTGDDIFSIALQYRVGESTVRKIIEETCMVIADVLSPIYLKSPTVKDWTKISRGFYELWNLPNCVGAVDGKHVLIRAPPNSGSLCFNYKKTFSLVLLATCDHQYKFTLVDIGSYGSESDGGIFMRSEIGKGIYNETLNLPEGFYTLPGSNIQMSYFFVGDDAFPLTRRIMKPYPGRGLTLNKRLFNYRLSRARRIIENSFGILVSRWRIFTKPICLNLDTIQSIITACICLHNYIITKESHEHVYKQRYVTSSYADAEDTQRNIIESQWRTNENSLTQLKATTAHRANIEAIQQREKLCKWMISPEGEVPWQYEYVCRGQHRDNQLH